MAVPVSFTSIFSLTRRRVIVFALAVCAPIALILSIGHIIVDLDPVERADAIYVLAGTRVTRLLEAKQLYEEGYAPRILLSPGDLDYAEKSLIRRGIPILNEGDRSREVLLLLGVPPDVVTVVGKLVDNTAQEAEAVRTIASGWRTLIVIGDRASSRRIGYAFRRVFGTRVKIIVTTNRDDPFNPSRWWETRWSFRSTFYEAPKLVAYWMGLEG
jgi:uncharacterized SAM-binding protein YcdF (DUF218 family)